MVLRRVEIKQEEEDLAKIESIKQEAIRRLTLLRNEIDQANVMNISEVVKSYRKEDFARQISSQENPEIDNFDAEICHLQVLEIDVTYKLKKKREELVDIQVHFEKLKGVKKDYIRRIKGCV
jgi:hypothetical protein